MRPPAQPAPPAPEPGHDATPGLDDAELLGALRAGDPAAATALYTRARPQVDRTIASLLHRRDASHEDLVQLAMIELASSIRRFRGDCSLDTWTSRITARTVFKELRKRRSEVRLLDSVGRIEAVRRQPNLERDVTQRDLVERLKQHLDAMDPLKAWTVVLHDVSGHDLREIAEITGASVAAAQSRLVRGRAELHERIERDPELREALEESGSER